MPSSELVFLNLSPSARVFILSLPLFLSFSHFSNICLSSPQHSHSTYRLRLALSLLNDRFRSSRRRSTDWKVSITFIFVYFCPILTSFTILQTSWCTKRRSTSQSRTSWTRHSPSSLATRLSFLTATKVNPRPTDRRDKDRPLSCHNPNLQCLVSALYIYYLLYTRLDTYTHTTLVPPPPPVLTAEITVKNTTKCNPQQQRTLIVLLSFLECHPF